MSQTKYIPEIDGLRAIAVLSVLFYHAKAPFIPGGFIGVDIFFVISGYLITRIINSGIKSRHFSFGEFYKRRIARIVPALYAHLIFVAVVFFLLYPPAKSQELFNELIASLLSAANFYFFFNIDYFSDAAQSPVLHTWSLAVEEQFYLLLPIILLLAASLKQWASTAIVALLLLASIVASIHYTPISPQAGFYLPWFRAWELLAGSLISFLPAASIPRRFKLLAMPVGMLMIAYALATYNEKMVFPGTAAIIPVAGTMLCLISTGSGGPFSWLLSTSAPRFFGKISYSLYLAHWPIICIALLFNALGSKTVMLALIFASIALGWLSWRFIENPLRYRITSARTDRVFAGFVLATIFTGIAIFAAKNLSAKFWERHPQAVAVAEHLNSSTDFFRPGKCFIYQQLPSDARLSSECLDGSKDSNPDILLIGDSHAANIYSSLVRKFPEADVLQATASGCLPLTQTSGDARCVRQQNHVLKKWLPENIHNVSAIVIAGRWSEGDVSGIIETIRYLDKFKKPILLVGPHPEYFISLPLLLSYQYAFGLNLTEALSKPDRFILDARLRSELSRNWPNGRVFYYSPIKAVCDRARVCATEIDGIPAMYDRDHFTRTGADYMMRNFEAKMLLR